MRIRPAPSKQIGWFRCLTHAKPITHRRCFLRLSKVHSGERRVGLISNPTETERRAIRPVGPTGSIGGWLGICSCHSMTLPSASPFGTARRLVWALLRCGPGSSCMIVAPCTVCFSIRTFVSVKATPTRASKCAGIWSNFSKRSIGPSRPNADSSERSWATCSHTEPTPFAAPRTTFTTTTTSATISIGSGSTTHCSTPAHTTGTRKRRWKRRSSRRWNSSAANSA